MRCDSGLVVGGAAAVEAAVALGGLERRRHPLAVIALGLHVVMGVQQHGRRSRRRRVPGDDGRGAALADDLHVREPGLGQQLCHRLGAALHFAAAGRVGPHRLDAHQVFQVAPHRRQHFTYPLHQIAHGDEVSRSVSASRRKIGETQRVASRRPARRVSAPRGRRPPRRCPLVGQRQVDRHVLQVFGDGAGQPHPRPTPHVGDHLDVAVDALGQRRPLREPRPRPRLDHRLLGGPPGRQVPRRRRTLVRGVAALTGGERLGEHRSRLVDLLGEVGYGDQVDAYPDYRHRTN